MDYTLEADTFAQQQKFVKPLSPFEILNANIEAGNDEQLMIKTLVESYGLQISSTKSVRGICAISSLEYINDKYGFHTLDRTLRLCIGAWEGEQNSLSSNMLRGIAKLVYVYEDKLRDDLFKEKVGKVSPKELSRTAKERRAGSLGYAEAMLIAYNHRMRNPLRMSSLYKTKPKNRAQVEEYIEPEEAFDDEQLPDMEYNQETMDI